jgi:integrase
MKRTRIGIGIYKTAYGFAVIWPEGGRNREKHFAPDTPLPTLTAYRKQQIKMAAPPPVRAAGGPGSLARDIVRWLRTRVGAEGYQAARSHVKAWLPKFGRRSRYAITLEELQLQIAAWIASGEVSIRTIRHRVDKLRQVYNLLDVGRKMPIHFVKTPKPPKTRPKGVSDDIIVTVAERLAEQERRGKLRDGKTRARFLVQATCGKRPCQVKRATPDDIDFAARIWNVQPAKGSLGGDLALNDEMLAAWQAFAKADAWGAYDSVSFAKTLRRNGWPDEVRPYQMRHQMLQTLNRRLPDFFQHVQQAGNHTNARTTREHYVPPDLATSRASSEALAGRFAPELFAETHRHRTGIRVGGTTTDDQGTTKDDHGSELGSEARIAAESGAVPAAAAVETTKDYYQGLSKTESETSGIVRKSANGVRLVRRPASGEDPSKLR